MGRGGKRKGAGRPAGAATKRTREAASAAFDAGLTPLDYMLSVMRDVHAEDKRRDWAAEKAAPYVHPKLASVEHSGPGGGPIEHAVSPLEMTDEEIEHRLAELRRGSQSSS